MEKNSILYILNSKELTEKKLNLFREKLKNENFTIEDYNNILKKIGYKKSLNFNDSKSNINKKGVINV